MKVSKVSARDRFQYNFDNLMAETETTHKALANAVGVSKVIVSRWRNGHACPTIDRLNAIAEALGIDVVDLLAE